MAVLEVKNLHVSIGGDVLVDGLDLAIQPGHVVGLCGESGAGKSMAAMAIAGLLPEGSACKGQIRLNGRPLDSLDDNSYDRIRGAEIGMVFQEPQTALNPLMPIGNQVAEVFLQHRRMSRSDALKQAEAVLRRVGLPPEKIPPTRLPDELSGGQRQRVVIAIAIALKPKLLIADEPTTALDATTQVEILNLLSELIKEDQIGLLLISHDLGVIARMADDLIIMDKGKVIESGSVSILDGGLRHIRAKVLAEATSLDGVATTAPHGDPLMVLENVSYHYNRRRVIGTATESNVAVDGISLTINEDEIVGIVGASGSGKTTLSRMILGLLEPTKGQITSRMESRPGAIFQDPYASFNPLHPISRLVAEPLDGMETPPSPEGRQGAVADMLQAVGVDPTWQKRMISQFSGGQRQRIALARAMITSPGMIIFDEPVSSLDASLRKRMLLLMATRARQHRIACIFISHDLSVVRAVCPRVLVMDQGRIVEDGTAWNVFDDPKHSVTKALVGASLDWQQELHKRSDTG